MGFPCDFGRCRRSILGLVDPGALPRPGKRLPQEGAGQGCRGIGEGGRLFRFIDDSPWVHHMSQRQMNRTSADAYLRDGCGRCDHYKTPACKVHRWSEELVALRQLLLASGLTEEMKWGSPCYTQHGKNIVMLVSRREYCALTFFKGGLLTDVDGVLERVGPNSHMGRMFKFTSVAQVEDNARRVGGFIDAAVAVVKSGRTAAPPPPEPMPSELEEALAADPVLAAAFAALTPGRRRSYILHISGAKQSKTRAARAERCERKILGGKGFNER